MAERNEIHLVGQSSPVQALGTFHAVIRSYRQIATIYVDRHRVQSLKSRCTGQSIRLCNLLTSVPCFDQIFLGTWGCFIGSGRWLGSGGVTHTIDLPDPDVVAFGVVNDRVEVVEVVGGAFREAELCGDAVTAIANNGSLLFGVVDCRTNRRAFIG